MDFLFSAGLLVLLGIFLTNVLDRRQKEQYSAMLQEQRTSFCQLNGLINQNVVS